MYTTYWKKLKKKLNILRKLKFSIDRKSLETIYFTHIRPILEYADIVWDNITQEMCNKLETINLEAARIVTGATKLTSLNKLYTETGWDTLQKRRQNHKLIQFHKMTFGLTPTYLQRLIPPKIYESHDHNTRNSNNLSRIKCRTNQYERSFLPSTTILWNELPPDIRLNPSISNLKRFLNKDKHSVPNYYNFGSRNEQILHARLRMECSTLNQHLYAKNLVENPFCSCGKIEDTEHFILNCPKYAQLRKTYIQNIPLEITTNLLLYGNTNLSQDTNKEIFKAVQNFIVKSKRFQRKSD